MADTGVPAALAEDKGAAAPADQLQEKVEQLNLEEQSPTEPADITKSPIEDLGLPKSAADGPIKKPFGEPLEASKPQPRPELTAEQKTKYESLLVTVSKWVDVPVSSAKGAATESITDDERMWLNRECLLRYLRATKWNVNEAGTRLMGTLTWRKEYNLKKLTPEYISIENETGKQVILGFDIHGRPCLYLNPSKQNTPRSDRQIEHLVYMLERVIDLTIPGQETLSLLINFSETKSGQGATLAQGKQTLYILQNHYPERLGRALITNVPFMIWGFFKLITPFIDPLTREKLRFNEDMTLHVPKGQLIKSVGGDVVFEYDHSVYWPTLSKLVEQRREAMKQRWIEGGKLIGENEDYLRGAAVKSVAQEKALVKSAPDAEAEATPVEA